MSSSIEEICFRAFDCDFVAVPHPAIPSFLTCSSSRSMCPAPVPARICEIPATKTLVGELKSYRLDHEFREFGFLSERGIGQPGHAKYRRPRTHKYGIEAVWKPSSLQNPSRLRQYPDRSALVLSERRAVARALSRSVPVSAGGSSLSHWAREVCRQRSRARRVARLCASLSLRICSYWSAGSGSCARCPRSSGGLYGSRPRGRRYRRIAMRHRY